MPTQTHPTSARCPFTRGERRALPTRHSHDRQGRDRLRGAAMRSLRRPNATGPPRALGPSVLSGTTARATPTRTPNGWWSPLGHGERRKGVILV
jgi:hypothetical protein